MPIPHTQLPVDRAFTPGPHATFKTAPGEYASARIDSPTVLRIRAPESPIATRPVRGYDVVTFASSRHR
jgi:hypothetical protein